MVRTQIEIHAPAPEVRKVCLDFAKIPEWHTGLIESIERVDGSTTPLEIGDQLRYRSSGVTGTPTIVVGLPSQVTIANLQSVCLVGVKRRALTRNIQENAESELRWKGSVSGLLYGNHFFRFEPSQKGQDWTRFVHGEDVTGALGFLFSEWSPIVSWLVRGQFETFNRDLKARVEGLRQRSTMM